MTKAIEDSLQALWSEMDCLKQHFVSLKGDFWKLLELVDEFKERIDQIEATVSCAHSNKVCKE